MSDRRLTLSNPGILLFWSALSLLFATGACYFYWQNFGNEREARTLRDQHNLLVSENDRLKAEVDRLQTELSRNSALVRNSRETLQESQRLLDQAAAEEKARAATAQALAEIRQRKQDALRSFLSKEDIPFTIDHNVTSITLSNRLLFSGVEPILKDEGKDLLKKIVAALDPEWASQKITIEAHTDDASPSKNLKARFPTNLDLSTARATSVTTYLTDSLQTPKEKTLAVGRGDAQPIASNEKPEGQAKNRRIVLQLSPLSP